MDQLLTALPVQLGITALKTIRTVQFAQMEQQVRKDLQNVTHAKEIHLLPRYAWVLLPILEKY